MASKLYLQKKLGLKVDSSIPMLGMVTRLTAQKGCQLVIDEIENILKVVEEKVLFAKRNILQGNFPINPKYLETPSFTFRSTRSLNTAVFPLPAPAITKHGPSL